MKQQLTLLFRQILFHLAVYIFSQVQNDNKFLWIQMLRLNIHCTTSMYVRQRQEKKHELARKQLFQLNLYHILNHLMKLAFLFVFAFHILLECCFFLWILSFVFIYCLLNGGFRQGPNKYAFLPLTVKEIGFIWDGEEWEITVHFLSDNHINPILSTFTFFKFRWRWICFFLGVEKIRIFRWELNVRMVMKQNTRLYFCIYSEIGRLRMERHISPRRCTNLFFISFFISCHFILEKNSFHLTAMIFLSVWTQQSINKPVADVCL